MTLDHTTHWKDFFFFAFCKQFRLRISAIKLMDINYFCQRIFDLSFPQLCIGYIPPNIIFLCQIYLLIGFVDPFWMNPWNVSLHPFCSKWKVMEINLINRKIKIELSVFVQLLHAKARDTCWMHSLILSWLA